MIMQEEIKEILEDYKQLAGEITEKLDNTAEYESWLIIQEYFDKLLNNITNLQNENERLTQGVTLLTNELIDMTKEKEDYKSRNEKAIQLNTIIDDKLRITNSTAYYKLEDLIFKQYEILQGVDKE